MKRILYFAVFCIFFLCNIHAYTQIKTDSQAPKQRDTSLIINKKYLSISNDTSRVARKHKTFTKVDTAYINKKPGSVVIKNRLISENIDSANINFAKDTSKLEVQLQVKKITNITSSLLLRNKFINIKGQPVYFIEEARHSTGKEFLFYALCIIVLILGVFKTFYSHYFNNLFRVFFNTSLRQTQLTDQLLQAKLPSFILNIFFTLTAGIYIWLLFIHFHPPRLISSKLLLPFCIISIALLYFIKYCLLKIMGWVSEIKQVTDSYIFVLFLVNKISGILLVPFIILLAFSMPEWTNIVATISLLVMGLFFLSRYVKSYGLIEKKIPLNRFHFLIYIIGGEIIPLFVFYKVAVDYLI
ncbi:MAG: DUF4271 domain-containing protein [Bacteroidota bacterium]|nr:DUF4271 domain-containing protein [Bacteroidota bacterium]